MCGSKTPSGAAGRFLLFHRLKQFVDSLDKINAFLFVFVKLPDSFFVHLLPVLAQFSWILHPFQNRLLCTTASSRHVTLYNQTLEIKIWVRDPLKQIN